MQDDRYEPYLKKIGFNVRRIRKEKGLSMEEVAHQADIEYRQLGRIERGEGNVTIVSLLRIADVLTVDATLFLQ